MPFKKANLSQEDHTEEHNATVLIQKKQTIPGMWMDQLMLPALRSLPGLNEKVQMRTLKIDNVGY